MSTPKFTQDTTFKTDKRVKNAFQVALKEVALIDRAQFGDRPPEMQSVTAALWNWFAALGNEERADWLAREFPRVIAAMGGAEPGREEDITARASVTPGRRPDDQDQRGEGRKKTRSS